MPVSKKNHLAFQIIIKRMQIIIIIIILIIIITNKTKINKTRTKVNRVIKKICRYNAIIIIIT